MARKRVKIISAPQMQVGGELRSRWNQNQQGNIPIEQWNHNPNIGQQHMQGIQPWEVAPVQDEVTQWQSGSQGPLKQGAIQAPNGISRVDGYIGNKTGAYSYRPLTIVNEHHGQSPTITNYGTDYERGIAENNKYLQGQITPVQAQWQSNDQGIPMAANTPSQGYRPQQGNWHIDENANYSVDSVRDQAQYGGMKKVRIVGMPNQMEYGGVKPGTAQSLDTIEYEHGGIYDVKDRMELEKLRKAGYEYKIVG